MDIFNYITSGLSFQIDLPSDLAGRPAELTAVVDIGGGRQREFVWIPTWRLQSLDGDDNYTRSQLGSRGSFTVSVYEGVDTPQWFVCWDSADGQLRTHVRFEDDGKELLDSVLDGVQIEATKSGCSLAFSGEGMMFVADTREPFQDRVLFTTEMSTVSEDRRAVIVARPGPGTGGRGSAGGRVPLPNTSGEMQYFGVWTAEEVLKVSASIQIA